MKKIRRLFLETLSTLLICTALYITPVYAGSTTIEILRLSGTDRYETSVAISKSAWVSADTVIIANGEGYADALAASSLSKMNGAPILLTKKDGMSTSTINEIKRLKASKAILVGGTGVVGGGVEKQLNAAGLSFTRLGGKDRYDTSKLVGESLGVKNGIIIATGLDYPDALSIAPIAGSKSMPILLSPKDSLNPNVADFIKGKDIPVSYLVGGTGVLGSNIEKAVPKGKRLGGLNRFETNISINSEFDKDLNFDTVYLATGKDFPDALSGSALAARNNAPIILTEKASVPDKVLSFIKSKNVKKVIILGGTGAVDQNVESKLDPSRGTTEGKILGALEKYSVDSLNIFNAISKDTGKSVIDLIARWKQSDIFSYLDTAVHETCHGYEHSMYRGSYDFETKKWTYYLAPFLNSNTTYKISFVEGTVFKTEEMGKNIPSNLRTFRWSTYVAPGASVTANQWGVYGLLDELDAYYCGIKATYETYEFLKELPYSDSNWFNYYSTLDQKAFYEFKFWTLKYLIYASQNKPEVYKSIINNTVYKAAFKGIYTNFENLIEKQIPARKNEMVKYLNSKGKNAKISNGFLYINNSGKKGDDDMNNIKGEMKKAEYQNMLNILLK